MHVAEIVTILNWRMVKPVRGMGVKRPRGIPDERIICIAINIGPCGFKQFVPDISLAF